MRSRVSHSTVAGQAPRASGFRRGSLLWLLGAGLAWLAAGCASVGSTPGWVNGELPSEYPKSRFVSALGTGDGLDAARANAKSELSRVFSAELSSEARLIEEEATRGGESTSQSSMLVDTTIRTDIELQGAEVPLHWRDPRSGEIWALAVLERNKECLRIRSEGRDLVTRLETLGAQTRSATNPLAAIRSATQAARIGVVLDGLQARSRVLGTQCLPARSRSTGALLSDLESRMNDLRFVVNAREFDARTGESIGPLPQLRERIAKDLTDMGFQVGPTAGRNLIPIEARLRLQRVERGTSWVEYRWEGSAEIGSPIAGDPAIVAAQGEGAESHTEPATARLRARQKGEQSLAGQLSR
ncbi:MAG: LPP20 family lipoprotein, partial [bacterium]